MVKIGTINAFPGSQLNDYSTNNTVVINPDKEDQPIEDQTEEKPAPLLKINDKERKIIDFIRVINALAESDPGFFLKNGKKAKKGEILNAFGSIVGLTEKEIYNSINSAKKNNNDTSTHTAIFDELSTVSLEFFTK